MGQAESIHMLGHRPNRVISLELPYEGVADRLSNRMLDPITGNHYHMLWNAPESAQIMERLVKAPRDQDEFIKDEYAKHQNTIQALCKCYQELETQQEKPVGGILVKMNADHDIETLTEYAESMLISPVPNNSG